MSKTAATFPLEIWFIILDLAVAHSLSPLVHCNPFNFPDISYRLRSPWLSRTTNTGLRDLRLVCRAFYAHLKASPYLYVRTSSTLIKYNARAVYLEDYRAEEFLPKLINGPLSSHQIITLNIQGGDTQYSQSMMFDILCENAQAFAGVRNLSLGLRHHTSKARPTARFWARLNEAFPCLESLVLKNTLRTILEDETVVFEHLEIMELGLVYPTSTVQFPALRHAGFASMSLHEIPNFTGWSNLDSLLLRDIPDSDTFSWNLVPQLQMIGIPSRQLKQFALSTEHRRLIHLFVYVGNVPRDGSVDPINRQKEDVTWVKHLNQGMPAISKITLAFWNTDVRSRSAISGNFDDNEVNALGFSVYYPRERRYDGGVRIIMDRIPIKSRVTPQREPNQRVISKSSGFQARWDKFSALFLS